MKDCDAALSNDLRRVHVGIGGVTTVEAAKDRLGIAVLRVDMATHGTGLRRVRGGHGKTAPTVPRTLVLQLATDLTEADAEDGAVQPRFLPDFLPWGLDGAARTGRHRGDAEVLDHDHRCLADDGGGEHMLVVSATVRDVALMPCKAESQLPLATAAACAPCNAPLQARVVRALL